MFKHLLAQANEETSKKKGLPFLYVIAILLLGIAFMLASNIFGENKQINEETMSVYQNDEKNVQPAFGQKQDTKVKTIAEYEERYAEQLKAALEAIAGVEDVTVVVNIDTTETKVLEKNRATQQKTTEETDPQGGKRKIEDNSLNEEVVIIRQGEEETPIILTTKKPEIRGVLVVAKGADNIQVKKSIVEAVTRVLHVPSHRVAVMPKK
ncbi:stage III sporulation protein AG [Bacillus alveayuensis]|uniref:stage III sporulation protein AG n=1 Tax=Aeribacillus alveayuensis TaxID=279215 RepID=UPI0005CCBF2C|nr:stage III sporulation protein AG [Bacillus alveayuensis]